MESSLCQYWSVYTARGGLEGGGWNQRHFIFSPPGRYDNAQASPTPALPNRLWSFFFININTKRVEKITQC